jgi:hypothetical protein
VFAAGVGHASTDRPDPSTLGVVEERGSRHEGYLQSVPGSARADCVSETVVVSWGQGNASASACEGVS